MQLDLGFFAGYIIKAVGALFMLGGVAELEPFEKRVRPMLPLAAALLVLSLGSVPAVLIVGGKAVPAVCGAVTTVPPAVFFYKLIGFFSEDEGIIGNAPEVRRMSLRYRILLGLTAVSLAADIVNRFTGGTSAADAAGVVMVIAKVVFYCMLASCGFYMNSLRRYFDMTHGFREPPSHGGMKR